MFCDTCSKAHDDTLRQNARTQTIYFSNGQTERQFEDGEKHIFFANGSKKVITPDGLEFSSESTDAK